MNNLPTDYNLSSDKAKNTIMLKEVHGLAETITPQLGNIIFVPGLAEDSGKKYKTLIIDVDGKNQIIYKPQKAAKRNSLLVYSGEIFNHEGTEYLFRHVGGIPMIYKQTTFALAVHRQNSAILEIAFSSEECESIYIEYQAKLLSNNHVSPDS